MVTSPRSRSPRLDRRCPWPGRRGPPPEVALLIDDGHVAPQQSGRPRPVGRRGLAHVNAYVNVSDRHRRLATLPRRGRLSSGHDAARTRGKRVRWLSAGATAGLVVLAGCGCQLLSTSSSGTDTTTSTTPGSPSTTVPSTARWPSPSPSSPASPAFGTPIKSPIGVEPDDPRGPDPHVARREGHLLLRRGPHPPRPRRMDLCAGGVRRLRTGLLRDDHHDDPYRGHRHHGARRPAHRPVGGHDLQRLDHPGPLPAERSHPPTSGAPAAGSEGIFATYASTGSPAGIDLVCPFFTIPSWQAHSAGCSTSKPTGELSNALTPDVTAVADPAGVTGSLAASGGQEAVNGVVIFPQVPSAVSYGRSENVVAESCALGGPVAVSDDRVGLRGAGVPRPHLGPTRVHCTMGEGFFRARNGKVPGHGHPPWTRLTLRRAGRRFAAGRGNQGSGRPDPGTGRSIAWIQGRQIPAGPTSRSAPPPIPGRRAGARWAGGRTGGPVGHRGRPHGHHRRRRPPDPGPVGPSARPGPRARGRGRRPGAARRAVLRCPASQSVHPLRPDPLPAPDRPHRPALPGDGRPPARCRTVAPHPVPARRAHDDLRRRARLRGAGRGGHQDPQPLPRLPHLQRADGGHAPQGDPVRGSARNGQDLHGQGHGRRGRRAVPVRLVLGLPVHVLRSDQPQDPLLLQGAAPPGPPRRRRHRLHRGDRRHRRSPGHRVQPGRGRGRRRQRAADPAPVVRADPLVASASGARSSRRSTPGSPPGDACASRRPRPANILVIGATNRAERPRSGARPAGPIRPHHLLRPARPVRTAGHHRLLPGQEGPRAASWTIRPGARRWPP